MKNRILVLALILISEFAIVSCGGGSSSSGSGSGGGGKGGTGGGGGTPSYTLTVTKSAAIGGTVTSTPAGISCDATCTTQTATFTGSVTLAVTPNSAVSAIFTGWSGGSCTGVKSCSVTLSANTSISANFVALANNQLGLFLVTIGGTGTDYTGVYDGGGNPINVSSTEYVFSEVIPATLDWVVLDTFTSESWGSWTVGAFEQEDQAFEIKQTVPLPGRCEFTSMFNPHNSSVTSFSMDDGDSGENSIYGWEMNQVGIVNGNIYYKVPVEWDMFHLAYDLGGGYDMLPASGGKATALLGRTDPDNGATIDEADHGTLYAVFHNTQNATLTVWTRDLTTGKLAATPLRSYTVDEADTNNWSFNINNGILYGANGMKADKSTEVWSDDLSIPQSPQTLPVVLQTYPSSQGWLFSWGVDNGHVVLGFVPSSSGVQSSIGDLDTSKGTTQFYDFGSTNIISFVPIWLSGSSTASSSHAASKRHQSPVMTFGSVRTLTPVR